MVTTDKPIDFLMGADPEFLCKSNNTIVSAEDIVDNDSESVEFGCDGNGVNFEIRPAPSNNPLQLVDNIRNIFVKQCNAHPEFLKYNWVAGSFHGDYPLGGHIHFGLKSNVVRPATASKILSEYLGAISLLVEDKEEGQKRRTDSYGYITDTRSPDHGFEYRTLSSWLTSPYITASMLCLGKTIMFEILNNKEFKPKANFEHDDFYYMKTEKVRALFPEIWADVTKMHLYQDYKLYIDLLYHLVSNKLSWYPNKEKTMNEAWGLVDISDCFKRKIKMNAIWARYLQSIKK